MSYLSQFNSGDCNAISRNMTKPSKKYKKVKNWPFLPLLGLKTS